MIIVDRDIEPSIIALAAQYPVITITGPRQSGKTTLAKKLFPEKLYINLENPDQRELAKQDPRAFLHQIRNGAVLDEIQRAPEILSYLQEMIDAHPIKGHYVLTGSNHFTLLDSVTQSLAGRTVLLKLLPLTIGEIAAKTGKFSTDDLILHGFYPGVYSGKLNPTIAYRSYYETYIERDLRQILQIRHLALFQKFVRLCAGRIGQLFIASNLANEVGVSIATIQSWASILQASYILYFLPPYYANINKRLIKASKLYFYDVGLASYLLGIENVQQLSRDPLRGGLFENMVLMELLKYRANHGLDPNLFFYRDNHQNEVDVVFKCGSRLRPLEIKSAQTFNASFTKGLYYLLKLLPDSVKDGSIVYDGPIEQKIGPFDLVRFRNFNFADYFSC